MGKGVSASEASTWGPRSVLNFAHLATLRHSRWWTLPLLRVAGLDRSTGREVSMLQFSVSCGLPYKVEQQGNCRGLSLNQPELA